MLHRAHTFFASGVYFVGRAIWSAFFALLTKLNLKNRKRSNQSKYCSSTKMEENEFTCESYFVLHRESANKQMLPSISYLRRFAWNAAARITHICFVYLLVALHHHTSGIRNLQLKICWVCDSDICSHLIYLCHCWDTLSPTNNGNGISTVYSSVRAAIFVSRGTQEGCKPRNIHIC